MVSFEEQSALSLPTGYYSTPHVMTGDPVRLWIITSDVYKFTVGPEKRQFVIHAALVADQSPAFDRFVNSETTFILLTQYAYTGDYSVQESSPLPRAHKLTAMRYLPNPRTQEVLIPVGAASTTWPNFAARSASDLFATLPARGGPVQAQPASQAVGAVTNNPQANAGSQTTKTHPTFLHTTKLWDALRDEDNILLVHAHVYIFADCYGLEGLANLALRKLAGNLQEIKMTEETIGKITGLVEDCFADLTPPHLRSLVLLFVASKASDLWADDRFQDVLRSNTDLSTALLELLIQG
ncbi:hypothetical protein QBC34DRAFT_380846 [Podospora aff. communis PSN243]|uniref:BTB domain-containing protein n=1 Tax=Podospora aff. communis PSN243 TaxID=3040156 RepID=A0AAV9GLE6_9PEZI|nr:hypothetical protein QBC34DRAFT_380846 [Podospora aff. communis PSN243]